MEFYNVTLSAQDIENLARLMERVQYDGLKEAGAIMKIKNRLIQALETPLVDEEQTDGSDIPPNDESGAE